MTIVMATMPTGPTLDRLAAFGAPDDHLPECRDHRKEPRHGDNAGRCDWCRWALVTPEVETLLAIGDDATALCRCDDLDNVAAVVATAQLVRLSSEVDLGPIAVPSAREVADRVRTDARRRLDRLLGRIGHATRPGGPVEATCRRTAGALAATALQSRPNTGPALTLPTTVRDRLDALSREMSASVQAASLVPAIDQLHRVDLPVLRTQPEWQRRTDALGGDSLRLAQLRAAGPAPGSLESLVLEAMIDRCTRRLMEVGDDFASVSAPVAVVRRRDEPALDGAVRRTLWRVLCVDWHLTLADTGLADCWPTRHDDSERAVEIPWFVALAIEVGERQGLGSAIHGAAPELRPA